MADHFVGPVIEKLIDAYFKYMEDQGRWQRGMKEELQSLRDIHPQIKAVVSAYSQVEIKDPNLNKWLWRLRDAVDEADDVLDEFEYQKLAKQARTNKKRSKVRSLMKSLNKRFVKICKRALKIDPSLNRLLEALQKLYKISAEVSTFIHLLNRASQEQQQQQLELQRTRETGSLIQNDLLGRSNEMEFVRNWLTKPYQTQVTDTTDLYRNISVLSVVGHGGMGKTTLLQHVYENEMTEEFDVKMWVCVSNNFDAITLIKNILESLKKEKIYLGPIEPTQNKEAREALEKTLEALQKSLRSEVTSKRFLLVLDDIWEEDERKWEKVLAPLRYGSFGSKILITTRMDSEDECLQLFNTYAFAGVENPDDEFRSIAREMVKKLSKCPLAAKVIGGILNDSMDKSYWTKVLNTNIGNIEPGQNYLLPILKLSYIYLPTFLQNCFSFCCIFPQDHEFYKDDLVRMWVALGFIQSSNIRGVTLEDTGRRYFNILVQKSFFDEFRTSDDKVCYKMHDLLHELAQFVSTQECCRVVDNEELPINPPETIRHLSIDTRGRSNQKALLKMIGKFKNLRSLLLLPSRSFMHKNFTSKILMASKNIRLLLISVYSVPKTIACLIHLRYLKIEGEDFFRPPRSMRQLYHLQFMIAMWPQKLELDNNSWKACNLLQGGIGRQELKINENCQLITDTLDIKDPSVLLMEPLKSISSFRSLQIGENNLLASFPTEIEQWLLQHTSSLFELTFYRLKSLQSLPSVLESIFSLKTLHVHNVPQLKLLPNPPASLQTLVLETLKSLQCLSSSLSTISSLMTLNLRNIPLLKSLPDLPSLKKLQLYELKSLQCLPSSLSSLETLDVRNIPLLKSLPDLPSSLTDLYLNELENLDSLASCFPTPLNKLSINKIPRLLELPDLPSSVEMLKLTNLESLQCLPSSLPTFSSLKTLYLENIPLLKSLPDLPSSLKDLQLKELKSLQCLPSSLLTISSLETLKLINIPLLESLPDLPSSLKDLKLKELKSLQCLPSSLPTSSVQTLYLENIPLLESLSDLPSSLKDLQLEELKSLQCLPSSLSTISSLKTLKIKNIPLLKSLPDFPSSLEYLNINKVPRLQELPDFPSSLKALYIKHCHRQLRKRYKNFDTR